MKVINITPENTYSCRHCTKEFQSPIELTLLWFCGNSCTFKCVYSIVVKVFPGASREKQFALTKKCVEVSLR